MTFVLIKAYLTNNTTEKQAIADIGIQKGGLMLGRKQQNKR